MASLNELSCTDIAQGIAAGKFTAEAVTRDCLERIKAREDAVKAWATIDPEHALAQARALEGVESYVRVAKGDAPARLIVRENGAVYFADPQAGQKSGWYYDQRDNRLAASSAR